MFTTKAVFIRDDGAGVQRLGGSGLDAGRRTIDKLTADDLERLIAAGSNYLASQVREDGCFHYGWHPCFDRPIGSYNGLRHASSLYAMLEAWEVTRSDALKDAIDRALDYLTNKLIRTMRLPEGGEAAFLVDEGNEIKLGANAVAILALVKHAELTGASRNAGLLEKLGLGILHMQDPATGSFVHVLDYPTLKVRQAFRIIYYEGEAAFGLLRLYGLTGDARWLKAVENAFEHFIREKHWKSHDHWLSYCVNELTLHRPEERYYQFGIDNFRDYLDFVLKRITTFPTLLELMMAARKMLERLHAEPDLSHLVGGVDLPRFYKALHHRAHYLLNGHFWPELAMFFAAPSKIEGSFFIRHHSFRVRIDDVEHYLSGLIAYREHLLAQGSDGRAPELGSAEDTAIHWTATHVARATGGRWTSRLAKDWRASGLCIFPPTMTPGDMVAVRLSADEKGVAPESLSRLPSQPRALITSNPGGLSLDGIPVLAVDNVGEAILALGKYARQRMSGRLLGVTGSAGKTTTVAMLAHALQPFGPVGQTRHNANLPFGIAWNLASIPWDTPHIVLELAIGRMGFNARMARPDVAIFTNILPAHLEYHRNVQTIAERKSAIFRGMEPGGIAVLNREMAEWETVRMAARACDLTVLNYGRSADCEYRLLDYDPASRTISARIGSHDRSYRIGAEGEHMALNSLAVLAATSALGLDPEPVMEKLAGFRSLPGRGEELPVDVSGRRITLIDDAYNANPGSMAAALARLGDKVGKGRRVAVLGEMLELGDGAAAYHTDLAPLIERHRIDRVHAVGALYKHFWGSLPASSRGARVDSSHMLQPVLRDELREGDTLLVKGSHGARLYELVDWLKDGAPALGRHLGAMLYDVDTGRTLKLHGEGKVYPPASLTKLLTLGLIDERLRESGESAENEIRISPRAADVNSHWGFKAGDRVRIETLMRAAMTVSANEAANALAEWHSGSLEAFTDCLNRRGAELGMTDTCFSSPSGLGRGQKITVRDALTLARHIQDEHPNIARLATARRFEWNGKGQNNTNTLLSEIPGADGLKTGRLGPCFNLIFSVAWPEGRRLAIVLGARSRIERDAAIKALLGRES
ncbi:Mur ligase family protein [Tsuneonella sp. CC-YZS046]|uniref:Mur ligase family protein n=1 Tax=Tsuneonella sp. CC-YZS046 TaxID=3042152 RepID=UPI002D7925A5|nr:Mur ligase family protein [Tsuneonella sp. CC-YZS046]WRO65545.1 Mur ligase family protein [Tsuneonella sp. CC-YZS046]